MIVTPLKMIVNPFKMKDRISLIALIIANLVPLFGVIFAGWDAGMIVVLYWGENLIVGFYTVLRIAGAKHNPPPNRASKSFVVPFFCVHYGVFCLVHGLFVRQLVRIGERAPGAPEPSGFATMLVAGIWPLAALAVSHGVSYVRNYLLKREFAQATVLREMMRPYTRLVVLHFVVLVAAVPIELLGSPMPMMVLLIVGKMLLDLWLHNVKNRDFLSLAYRMIRKAGVDLSSGQGGTE